VARVWWQKVPVPRGKRRRVPKGAKRKVTAKDSYKMVVGTLGVTVEEDGRLVDSLQSIEVMARTTKLPTTKQLDRSEGACGCTGPMKVERYAGTLRYAGLTVPDYAIRVLPRLEGLDLPGHLDTFARGFLDRKDYADLPQSHREVIVLFDPTGGKVQRLKKQAKVEAAKKEFAEREKSRRRGSRHSAKDAGNMGDLPDDVDW